MENDEGKPYFQEKDHEEQSSRQVDQVLQPGYILVLLRLPENASQ